jgi:two-component sensor histidine kinase
MASGEPVSAASDASGGVWVGTLLGLARLRPSKAVDQGAPQVWITAVDAGGRAVPVSDIGEAGVDNIVIPHSRNQLRVNFVAIGERLRYRYKLEGLEHDWSPLTNEHALTFSQTAPGSYRLLIQAVNPSGAISRPASVSFAVQPAFYSRWWFESIIGALVILVAYFFHAARVRHLVELQKVRLRIAHDLHDDIGASLSQVAVLSEVALTKLDSGHPASEPLTRIAEASREMVDSISDIVWAINPKRDSLTDLLNRIRRFANDVLTTRNIQVRFRLPSDLKMRLMADVRRQIYLIFKEGIHNIARHATCTEVQLEIHVDSSLLTMKLSDNGCSFYDGIPLNGHGLESMRQRAASIGGTVQLQRTSYGTSLLLQVPLERGTPVLELSARE